MSEEERNAIDILQNIIADTVIGDYCGECCPDRDKCKEECWIQETFDIITNLIEKQQKEIKTLTNTNKSYKGQLQQQGNDISRLQKEIKELKADNYEANCRINDLLEIEEEHRIENGKLREENTEYEENRLWSEATIQGLKKDFIPRTVIKDKIEEYKKELEINKDNIIYQKLIYTSKEVIREEIQALEELLEEGE